MNNIFEKFRDCSTKLEEDILSSIKKIDFTQNQIKLNPSITMESNNFEQLKSKEILPQLEVAMSLIDKMIILNQIFTDSLSSYKKNKDLENMRKIVETLDEDIKENSIEIEELRKGLEAKPTKEKYSLTKKLSQPGRSAYRISPLKKVGMKKVIQMIEESSRLSILCCHYQQYFGHSINYKINDEEDAHNIIGSNTYRLLDLDEVPANKDELVQIMCNGKVRFRAFIIKSEGYLDEKELKQKAFNKKYNVIFHSSNVGESIIGVYSNLLLCLPEIKPSFKRKIQDPNFQVYLLNNEGWLYEYANSPKYAEKMVILKSNLDDIKTSYSISKCFLQKSLSLIEH